MKLRYEGTKVGGYDGYEGRHDSILILTIKIQNPKDSVLSR